MPGGVLPLTQTVTVLLSDLFSNTCPRAAKFDPSLAGHKELSIDETCQGKTQDKVNVVPLTFHQRRLPTVT